MRDPLQVCVFFFSSRRRHTRCSRDWSSDVCSSDLMMRAEEVERRLRLAESRLKETEESLAAERKTIEAQAGEIRKDRKSTRLNSSHGYISYAVFCLKKKNKTLRQSKHIHLGDM